MIEKMMAAPPAGDSEQAGDLSALVAASSLISASLDSGILLDTFGEQLLRFSGAAGCAIYEWEPDNNRVKCLWFSAQRKALCNSFRPVEFQLPDYPLTQQVLEVHFPIQLQNNHPEKAHPEYRDMAKAGIHTLLLVPIVGRERALGFVELFHTDPEKKFNHDQVNLVQTLANQAAVALLNARLYEQSQRQLKTTALLNKASRVIGSSLDTKEILQSLLSQMNELIHANAISIALLDEETYELVYEVAEGPGRDTIIGLRIPANQGVAGWVVQNRESALVADTSQDPRFFRQVDKKTGYQTQSIICAPLLARDTILGTIQAINPLEGDFNAEDLQLLDNLANLASIALLNARQYEQTQIAEARYLGLFEDSINPILLTDESGNIVEASHRAEVFLGYGHGELLGQSILDLHLNLENHIFQPGIELADVAGEEVTTFYSLVRPKGDLPVHVEVYVKRTRLHGQYLLQWIYRNINQEVELDKMQEDLTAMLVHDLQSPLGNVISSLELLRYELPPNPMVDSILEISLSSSRRLQNLIRSLLDLTHLEAGRPVNDPTFSDLEPLIADAANAVQPTLKRRNIKLKVNLPSKVPLPPFYGDEDMIHRVIVNLLDNAVKYSPDNTTVTLTGRLAPEEDDRLLIIISDQGRGIPPEYRNVIFQKFRRIQGKNAPKGIGLGLAFCRLAVEAHGGRIWVDDAPGGGARFNFTLPTRPF